MLSQLTFGFLLALELSHVLQVMKGKRAEKKEEKP